MLHVGVRSFNAARREAERGLQGRIAVVCTDVTQSVFKVVLQKSTPPQIIQIILSYYTSEEYLDGCVWECFFAKRLQLCVG